MEGTEVFDDEVVSDPLSELARIAGAEAPAHEVCQTTARYPYADEARAILSGEKEL